MRVWVEREGGDESEGEKAWVLVVSREATVHQLKQSLKHHVALQLVSRASLCCLGNSVGGRVVLCVWSVRKGNTSCVIGKKFVKGLHEVQIKLPSHYPSISILQSRKGIKKRISWKYVWKSNWLSYEGTRLTDDNAKLHQYGIRNKSTLKFVKKYRDKQKFGRRKK